MPAVVTTALLVLLLMVVHTKTHVLCEGPVFINTKNLCLRLPRSSHWAQLHLPSFPFTQKDNNLLGQPCPCLMLCLSSEAWFSFWGFSTQCEKCHLLYRSFVLNIFAWFLKDSYLFFFRAVRAQVVEKVLVSSSDIILSGQNFVSVPNITYAFVGFANEQLRLCYTTTFPYSRF